VVTCCDQGIDPSSRLQILPFRYLQVNNKMKIFYKLLIPIFAIMSLYCCAQKDSAIEYGRFVSNTYTNNQFNLSIVVPDEFYFMDKNSRSILSKQNVENIIDNSELPKKIIETTFEETAPIFTIFKFKPDTIIEVNPNMTITVTNISQYPNLKNIEYAVDQTIEGVKEFNTNFVIEEGVFDVQINNNNFTGYNSKITVNQMTANYESYLGNFDDFNMVITISYKTEIEKQELLEILNGIKTCR